MCEELCSKDMKCAKDFIIDSKMLLDNKKVKENLKATTRKWKMFKKSDEGDSLSSDEFELFNKFLYVLEFCATVKKEFHKNIEKRQILTIYCKYEVLPKAREVLNSANIKYRYENFAIKIDSELNGKDLSNLKVEDWLVEEEDYVEKKEEDYIKKKGYFKKKGYIKKKNKKWAPVLETIDENEEKFFFEKAPAEKN
uniref:Uncharacterized protein n=1 Tax=Meloidogyne hapla TaxID=6305 RepID=A0A1I8BT13_MELHA